MSSADAVAVAVAVAVVFRRCGSGVVDVRRLRHGVAHLPSCATAACAEPRPAPCALSSFPLPHSAPLTSSAVPSSLAPGLSFPRLFFSASLVHGSSVFRNRRSRGQGVGERSGLLRLRCGRRHFHSAHRADVAGGVGGEGAAVRADPETRLSSEVLSVLHLGSQHWKPRFGDVIKPSHLRTASKGECQARRNESHSGLTLIEAGFAVSGRMEYSEDGTTVCHTGCKECWFTRLVSGR